jgi:hypothetical protein
VLKDEGVLLMSVPYYSPLRKLLSPLKRREWRTTNDSQTDGKRHFDDKEFFQYAYTYAEFSAMLGDAGLRVVRSQGYAVLWGLYEIPFLDPGEKSESASSTKEDRGELAAVDVTDAVKDRPTPLLKRLVVSEDAGVPVLGLGVRFIRWFSANMMMYVCRRVQR